MRQSIKIKVSFQQVWKFLLHFFKCFSILLIILDIRMEQIIQFFTNTIKRFLTFSQPLLLQFLQFMFLEQQLVLTILIRIRILLIDKSYNVIFTVFVWSCLVGIVRTFALQTTWFVEFEVVIRFDVIKTSMLEFRFPHL